MPYNHAKWNLALRNFSAGFLPGIFFKGGGVKFIVMQISFVMLIFLLFSDQISGERQKGLQVPCSLWKKASSVLSFVKEILADKHLKQLPLL